MRIFVAAALLTFAAGCFDFDQARTECENGGRCAISAGTPVLLSDGLVSPGAATPEESLEVAFGGGQYMAVWEAAPDGDSGIYGATFASDGTFEGQLPISLAPGARGYPSLAFNGATFVVTWNDQRTGVSADIYAARVQPDGGTLDGQGMLLSSEDAGQKYVPQVGCLGQSCLVGWSDRHGGNWHIHGLIIDASLDAGSGGDLLLCGLPFEQFVPSLIAGDQGYLLTYSNQLTAGAVFDQRGTRVDANGNPLDIANGEGIVLQNLSGLTYSRSSLTFDGSRYWAGWRDDTTSSAVRLALVDELGNPTALGLVPSPGQVNGNPALSFDGERVWVAFSSAVADGGVVLGIRYELDGGATDPAPFTLSAPAPVADMPALASDGQRHVLLVYDERQAWDAGTALVHYRMFGE